MHVIEVVECQLPDRASIRDEFGNHVAYAKAKLAPGTSFWPCVLVDGDSVAPELAQSYLARGEAEFVGDLNEATAIVEALRDAALDVTGVVNGEERRLQRSEPYRDVVTAAVKVEVARMRAAYEGAPVVTVRKGNLIHEHLDMADVAKVFGVSVEQAIAWAGTKYAALTHDDGRVLINRWSVGRCCVGNTDIIDPLPNRVSEAQSLPRRRLLARSAA